MGKGHTTPQGICNKVARPEIISATYPPIAPPKGQCDQIFPNLFFFIPVDENR